MKLTRDIQRLSTFKRDTAKLVRQLKKTGQPVVLTVNGKAELVVQDAESYQKLLEAKETMEAIEGIKRGLESMKRNAGNLQRSSFKSSSLRKASQSANEALPHSVYDQRPQSPPPCSRHVSRRLNFVYEVHSSGKSDFCQRLRGLLRENVLPQKHTRVGG